MIRQAAQLAILYYLFVLPVQVAAGYTLGQQYGSAYIGMTAARTRIRNHLSPFHMPPPSVEPPGELQGVGNSMRRASPRARYLAPWGQNTHVNGV